MSWCKSGPEVEEGFLHGVGSFDPTATAVLIWTRYTPGHNQELAHVDWEVSESPTDFSAAVASGSVVTNAGRDFTVCVDVQGLQPCRRYYYRFSCGKQLSPVGATKTLADGHLDELLFGLVSCANWGWGAFNVYDLLSKTDNLDLVVHCGDYIYEYAKGDYPGRKFLARHGLRPKQECKSLADYRTRYGCYRRDPALQELHRRVPMIAIWDDHEVANEAYTDGATNDSVPQRKYPHRKVAGVRAYLEWVPVRGMPPEAAPDFQAAQRAFRFGDLATLVLMENRLSKRQRHVDLTGMAFYQQTAKSDPGQWEEGPIQEAKQELRRQLREQGRTMIGPQQISSIAEAVQQSVAAGQPWQVLVSQTIMSQLLAPKLVETVSLQPRLLRWVAKKALKYAMSPKKAGQEASELARQYVALGKWGLPMNPDAWDGYQAEREQVFAALDVPGSNPVVLAGDSHNAWAHELRDARGKRVGVEFDGPSVTSKGAFEDIYCRFEDKVGRLAKLFPLYLFTPWIGDALLAANPDTLKFCNLRQRGMVLCHLTHTKFHAEFHFVDQVDTSKAYTHLCAAAFNVEAGVKGVMRPGPRYLTIGGKVPRRLEIGRKRRLVKGTHALYMGSS